MMTRGYHIKSVDEHHWGRGSPIEGALLGRLSLLHGNEIQIGQAYAYYPKRLTLTNASAAEALHSELSALYVDMLANRNAILEYQQIAKVTNGSHFANVMINGFGGFGLKNIDAAVAGATILNISLTGKERWIMGTVGAVEFAFTVIPGGQLVTKLGGKFFAGTLAESQLTKLLGMDVTLGAGRALQIRVAKSALGQMASTVSRGIYNDYWNPALWGVKVPIGVSEAKFVLAGTMIKDALKVDGEVLVHGSRVAGGASVASDLDFAIRVSQDDFGEAIKKAFGTPNKGSAFERTMLRAIETGKIQSGEAGLRSLRKALEKELGIDVDISIVREYGPTDRGPFLSVPNGEHK